MRCTLGLLISDKFDNFRKHVLCTLSDSICDQLFKGYLCCSLILQQLFFFQAFMRRHPKLAFRTPERVSKKRSGITQDTILDWFHRLEYSLEVLKVNDILSHPERVFNSDETNIELCPKTGKVVGLRG